MLKVGMLTSGGDCQGLNAAMRGVAKSLYKYDDQTEIYGFLSGYKGLMNSQYQMMTLRDFSGILTIGGTILGTSRMSFKDMNLPLDDQYVDSRTRLESMLDTYHRMKLDALVVLGGNGTHKTANLLSEHGVNVVTLPKTIDNDLWGTDITFGFQSAIDIATRVIDGIHTTAESHGRIFIVEIMGHKVGWLPLYAGLSGGADIILIPEIPYNLESIKRVIEERARHKKRFSIIAMAEGAKSEEEASMSKKDYKKYMQNFPYPSVSYKLAHDLESIINQEVRVTVPGHFQRGGEPVPFDRLLATRCGAKAADMIIKKEFGYMVGLKGNKMIKVPLSDVAGKLKTVPTDDERIHAARQMGIYFGNESKL